MPSSPISLPGLSALEQALATTSEVSLRSRRDTVEREKDCLKSVVFLGRRVTGSEYREICRNLGEFFALLSKWRKESERA